MEAEEEEDSSRPVLGASPEADVIEEVVEEEEDSPVSLHLAFNRPRPEVLRVDQTAENLQKTAESISVSQFGF